MSPENNKITKEQVLEALKISADMEMLGKWIDQEQPILEKITDKKEFAQKSILFNIDKAKLYADAGYYEQSLEDLSETREIAYQAWEDDLCDQIDEMITEISEKMNGSQSENTVS